VINITKELLIYNLSDMLSCNNIFDTYLMQFIIFNIRDDLISR